MEYAHGDIEQKWQQYWKDKEVYKVSNDSDKPKYYVLDMFPYPSGAGLHVGHPLGYIASDILARYKRHQGFNVLHPMGYDAFGLPAEQYALETGQHPAVTTEQNIKRYREQLDQIGFCYDWSREVRTSDPKYYKWTQWIFLQLFHSWFDRQHNKARPISDLIKLFEAEGNVTHPSPQNEDTRFTADEWAAKDEAAKREILMEYRLAYLSHAEVWWCEALGTVLANDEVVNGVSERGSHPVVRKRMNQWFLRITEYADRLMNSLDNLDWTDAMKEMQRNWIGKSKGAEVEFHLSPGPSPKERGDNKTPNWNTAEPSLYSLLANKRKALKDNPTAAENILWQELRNQQLGVKFRRQHVIGRFIADFVCIPKKLIIEVDGEIHNEQKDEDALRTEYLKEKGYTVIRFTNKEVTHDINGVVNKIKEHLEALSEGEGLGEVSIKVFTTRPDTIFGVDFMVVAPEHELVMQITTPEKMEEVVQYREYVQSRSERERMSEVKQISGAFTGAYAIHPFTGNEIPVWISEYVLAGYGTGAIMAVPSGDDRDHAFARHFGIEITNVFGDNYNGEEAYSKKEGTIHNSDFLNGMEVPQAIEAAIKAIEEKGIGREKVNYKLRDAGFSRQRYWGEPFPIVYTEHTPYGIDEIDGDIHELPVELPHVESYKPGPEGQGPLANITEWVNLTPAKDRTLRREVNTMPGYAGSSWYFLRYMDPHNDKTFADRKATDYWQAVDVYVGGTEHAVGHLLYSRMWTKALYDLGHIGFDEPFRKLINQGMIQGKSKLIYRLNGRAAETIVKKIVIDSLTEYTFNKQQKISNFKFDFVDYINKIVIELSSQKGLKNKYQKALLEVPNDYQRIFISNEEIFNNYSKGAHKLKDFIYNIIKSNDNYCTKNLSNKKLWYISKSKTDLLSNTDYNKLNIDISFVENDKINLVELKNWRKDFSKGSYILDNNHLLSDSEIEKMSKSKYNVVNPDDIVAQYGADTFRMYEMFLGPIDVSKPWDTKGIEGVHRFLKKMWRLYHDDNGSIVTDDAPTEAELKTLHKTIKKVSEDIEKFSFNTAVSQFMICVNELSGADCHKREVLEPLAVLIAPFAPHFAEELWHSFGHEGSVVDATYPKYEEKYVTENSKKYPVAINGKARTEMEFPLDVDKAELEKEVLANEVVQKWVDGKPVKKFIYVPGRMINVVV